MQIFEVSWSHGVALLGRKRRAHSTAITDNCMPVCWGTLLQLHTKDPMIAAAWLNTLVMTGLGSRVRRGTYTYGVELRPFYIYYTEAFNQQNQVTYPIELLINFEVNAHIISPCPLRMENLCHIGHADGI